MARRYIAMIPGVISTNLGRLEFPETYGPLQLERIMHFAPAGGKQGLVMRCVGVSGTLSVTLNYTWERARGEDDTSGDGLRRIRDRAFQLLLSQ